MSIPSMLPFVLQDSVHVGRSTWAPAHSFSGVPFCDPDDIDRYTNLTGFSASCIADRQEPHDHDNTYDVIHIPHTIVITI
jgi:hypothetical protein